MTIDHERLRDIFVTLKRSLDQQPNDETIARERALTNRVPVQMVDVVSLRVMTASLEELVKLLIEIVADVTNDNGLSRDDIERRIALKFAIELRPTTVRRLLNLAGVE